MKKLFLIPSLIAAGFMPTKASALPGQGGANPAKSTPLLDRLRIRHLFTLAGHSSHSSHSSHASHASHASSSSTTYLPPVRRVVPAYIAPTYDNSDEGSTTTYTPDANPSDSGANNDTFTAPQPLLKTLPGNSQKFKRIVMQVQSALYIYGYYKGGLTGIIDDPSRDALKRMQTDYNLTVTGTVTPEVLTALGIEAK